MKRILTCIILMMLLVGCSQPVDINDTPNELNEDVNSETALDTKTTEPIEEVDTHDEIDRVEGYNSILLQFSDTASEKPLDMSLEIEGITSTNTNKTYNLDDAKRSEILLEYKDSASEYVILLKDGYKLRAIMNPLDKDSIANWMDYKANYPLELTAIKEGSNQLNMFNINIDYNSDIVQTMIETTVFE